MLTVVGTLALDTLARVKQLAAPETTGGVRDILPDVPGGTAGNVVTALARLGMAPKIVAAVGPDFAGSAYERALRDAGVDLSALVHTDSPMARAYMFIDGEGGQVTYFYGGAAHALTAAHASVSGRVHFAAGEISAYPALMQQANWVSFDPGQELFHRDIGDILACLPLVDVLFVNHHELARFEKLAGLDVEGLKKAGVSVVVETRGARGTVVHAEGLAIEVTAAPADALDPTGAGDAHRAGFLFALAQGASWEVAAKLANTLGAFAVEHVGAQNGLPTLAEARARYEKTYGAWPFD